MLKASRPRYASLILVALPDAFQSRRVIELARELNPKIGVAARAHSEEEYRYLMTLGCDLVVVGEHEIAHGMSKYALRRMSSDAAETEGIDPQDAGAALSGS